MRHLLFATSLLCVGSLAVPAIAQDAGVGVGVGAGVGAAAGASAGAGIGGSAGASSSGGVGAGVSGSAGIGVDSSAGATGGVNADTTADVGVTEQALGTVDDQLVVGAAVISSDAAEIGTITDIALDANRQVVITVDLADDLGMTIDSIRIRSNSAAFVEQRVRLDVTKANFVTSLEAYLNAEVAADETSLQ